MTQDVNKKYIKNLIISGLEGKKINKQESEELEKAVLSFNQTEWRNFKIIGKEAVKEWIDGKIDNAPQTQIPSNWRGDSKKFFHALVDFAASLVSEEIIIESVRLEREKIPWEQRMRILVPLYTKQLEKIAARKSTKKISDSAYHKAEVNLVKKVKQLRSMYKMSQMVKRPTKRQVLGAVKKLINLFKNLSADEILVAKEKGKSLAGEYLTNYAPAEFHQYPELKSLANSFINFWDAVLDEKLLAEAIKLTAEGSEILLKNFSPEELESFADMSPSALAKNGEKINQVLQRSGMENRARQWLANLTNHLNRLASEEFDNSNISSAEEQSIIQKLSNPRQLSGTGNSSENTGTGLTFLSPANAFGSIKGGSDSLSEEQFWNKILDKYTTVESKGKWYQNPRFIGFAIVGALVVGGLIVWLLTRRKKEKVVDNQHDTW